MNPKLDKSMIHVKICLIGRGPNLMNLSRVLNSPKNRFKLSAGLNREKLNTILSGTDYICAAP